MTQPKRESISPQPSRRSVEFSPDGRSEFATTPDADLIQLSRNESAIRLQPSWIAAATEAANSAVAYPDTECHALREAIAQTFGLDQQRIFCSAGLMECLYTLALAYLDPGDRVVIPEHAFVLFRQVARMTGADVILVPERNLRVDVGGILDAVDESTKMVIFANPANPTGTYVCRRCVAALHSRLPLTTLLVIDEAYAEFVHDDSYEPLFDLAGSGNVIVLRSFSKMYGLAGYRVGWAYTSPAVVDSMRRIRVPASVNSVGQAIAAVAVRDQTFVRSFKLEVLAIRRQFIDRLSGRHRIAPLESETNFVLLQTASEAEACSLDRFLRQRGIFLRPQGAVGLGHCLRATIGTEEQMQIVAATIIEWCSGEET